MGCGRNAKNLSKDVPRARFSDTVHAVHDEEQGMRNSRMLVSIIFLESELQRKNPERAYPIKI